MRVLLTGHQGFVGHHIAKQLLKLGHTVAGVDDERSGVRLSPSGVESYRGNFGVIFPVGHISAVIHCAAHADVSRNWDSRQERERLWQCNVNDTISLFEGLLPSTRMVFISTLAAEADELSPYSASKIAGETLARTYFPDARILRLSAVVGSGYHHGHIADFVRMARSGGIKARSDGKEPRSYVHVADVAKAAVEAATSDWAPGTVALAGDLWSPRDTVAVMGAKAEWGLAPFGWRGDVAARATRNCYTPIADGVRDALESLGWK